MPPLPSIDQSMNAYSVNELMSLRSMQLRPSRRERRRIYMLKLRQYPCTQQYKSTNKNILHLQWQALRVCEAAFRILIVSQTICSIAYAILNVSLMALDILTSINSNVNRNKWSRLPYSSSNLKQTESVKRKAIQTGSHEAKHDLRCEGVSIPPSLIQQRPKIQIHDSKNKGLQPKLMHWNINGLRGKIEEAHLILTDKNPIILALSETKLEKSVPEKLLTYKGYEIIRRDRNSHGGGLLVYCRNDINVLAHDLIKSPQDIEIINLRIKLNWSLNLSIIVAYRPPAQNLSVFLTQLNLIVTTVNKDFPRDLLVILGDLNCNWLNKNSNDSNNLREFCRTFGLYNGIKEVTRVVSGTSIDVILTSNKRLHIDFIATPNGASDHSVCESTLVTHKNRSKPVWKHYRMTKKVDIASLNNELSSQKWHKVYLPETRNESADFPININCNNVWEKWKTILMKVVDKHAPCKRKLQRTGQKTWINSEIKRSIRLRDKAAKHAIDCESIKRFRELRNHVTLLKRKRKKEYFQNVIKEPNSLLLHQRLQTLTGLGKLKTGPPRNILANGNLLEDQKLVATAMNEAFLTLPAQTRQPLVLLQHVSLVNILSTRKWPNFTFSFTTDKEVESILKSLKARKAPGHDNIPTMLLKSMTPSLCCPITDLFNYLIFSNQVPLDFKKSIITPVFKKGDTKDATNYRPISNLTVISKCFESVLNQQLTEHFDNFLPEDMFGFRKNRCCETGLTTLLEHCRRETDQGKLALIISLDLSRAFDCVNHSLLLAKLRAMGMDETSVELIASYLQNRYQAVRIESSISQDHLVTVGVPQGSILGPLLFNLFVADLSWSVDANFMRYADDTNLVVCSDSYDELKDKAEEQLKKVVEWFEDNGLAVNPTKTQLLLACGSSRTKKHQRKDFFIKYSDTILRPCESIKLLGFTIDQDFQFKQQTQQVLKKIGFTTKLSSLVSHFVPPPQRTCLLSSYIIPQSDYCGIILFNSSNTHFKQIVAALQKSCKRLGVPKEAGRQAISSLETRWISRSLCILYEIIHSEKPHLLAHHVKSIDTPSTRSCIPVRLTKAKTSIMNHSVLFKSVLCWNKLPSSFNEVKESGNLQKFRSTIARKEGEIRKTWMASILSIT